MFFTGMLAAVRIKRKLSDLRYKQMKLHNELMARATYAANIADGIITPEEMASAPASIFGRQMKYMMQSVPMAMMQGQQAYQLYLPQYMAQMSVFQNNPQYNLAMQANPQLLQMQFFQQSLERQGEIEKRRLHVEEKKIQQELGGIEIQIQMLEAQLKGLKAHISESIKENAPTFGRGRA